MLWSRQLYRKGGITSFRLYLVPYTCCNMMLPCDDSGRQILNYSTCVLSQIRILVLAAIHTAVSPDSLDRN